MFFVAKIELFPLRQDEKSGKLGRLDYKT